MNLNTFNNDVRSNRLNGKTFYSICPDDSKKYKTVFIKYNPFSNSLIPHLSNPIEGTPPEHLSPLPAGALSYMMRVNMAGPVRDNTSDEGII